MEHDISERPPASVLCFPTTSHTHKCDVINFTWQTIVMYEFVDGRWRDCQAPPKPTLRVSPAGPCHPRHLQTKNLGERDPLKHSLAKSSCNRGSAPAPIWRVEQHAAAISCLWSGPTIHRRRHGWHLLFDPFFLHRTCRCNNRIPYP